VAAAATPAARRCNVTGATRLYVTGDGGGGAFSG